MITEDTLPGVTRPDFVYRRADSGINAAPVSIGISITSLFLIGSVLPLGFNCTLTFVAAPVPVSIFKKLPAPPLGSGGPVNVIKTSVVPAGQLANFIVAVDVISDHAV